MQTSQALQWHEKNIKYLDRLVVARRGVLEIRRRDRHRPTLSEKEIRKKKKKKAPSSRQVLPHGLLVTLSGLHGVHVELPVADFAALVPSDHQRIVVSTRRTKF